MADLIGRRVSNTNGTEFVVTGLSFSAGAACVVIRMEGIDEDTGEPDGHEVGLMTLERLVHSSETEKERTMRCMTCQRMGLPDALAPALASVWMDAFMAGAIFQQRGGHRSIDKKKEGT